MKEQSKRHFTKFNGHIQYVSVSPHGDPEAIVLEDGTFVKIPPHSLINKDLIQKGEAVEGKGELIREKPNRMFHHVQLFVGDKKAADDSMSKDKIKKLKEKHKTDLKNREDAPSKKLSLRGKAVAFGMKPKGEIDRIIFDDGTSVHIPKDVKTKEFEVGDEIKVEGEARMYGSLRFVKAKSVARSAQR